VSSNKGKGGTLSPPQSTAIAAVKEGKTTSGIGDAERSATTILSSQSSDVFCHANFTRKLVIICFACCQPWILHLQQARACPLLSSSVGESLHPVLQHL